jgi:hypothetical protein
MTAKNKPLPQPNGLSNANAYHSWCRLRFESVFIGLSRRRR